MPAGLPNFEELVVDVYRVLDPPVHQVMEEVRADPARQADGGDLEPQQVAEVRQFAKGEYDVVLGMLERRLDGSWQAVFP